MERERDEEERVLQAVARRGHAHPRRVLPPPKTCSVLSESMGSGGAVVGAGDAAALRLVLSVVGGSKVILDGGETNFAVGAVARGVG